MTAWRVLAAAAVVWLAATVQALAQDEVERAPVPAWVVPVGPSASEPPADDAPIRVLISDQQIRFDDEGTHDYTLRRSRVQNRQGLPYVSTVNAVWNPTRQRVQVHAVRIIRGDQVIDALDGQTFEILRREDNLESSMLDGQLTATLQPRDLRVGDIIETAFTIHDTGGVLAPHREQLVSGAAGLTIGRFHLRVSWPGDQTVRAEATAPWADIRPRRVGGDWVYEVNAENLAPDYIPDDVPTRFSLVRVAQFTDFADWATPSRRMAPLYAQGSTLEAGSPLVAEIERIRAAHATDAERAAAALRLVQDEVRYVALSMGEGSYVPTPADEVWRSRYGDCKGKTVLLLALLHGLGIEAEAAMVSTGLGDGLPDRLPLIGWFDHVIVRAEIEGRTYWMDGTRVGDRTLAGLTPPPYRWALPVRTDGAELTAIEQPVPTTPNFAVLIQADATAGLDADAPMVLEMAYYGDAASSARQQFSSVPADQLETFMLAQFEGDDSTTRIEKVETRYDDEANVYRLILRGSTRLSWVHTTGGRIFPFSETATVFSTSDERKGLYAAFKDAPYAIGHPFMSRMETQIRLPDEGRGFRLEGGDRAVEGGGYRTERTGRLENGVATVVVVSTSLAPEISAAEMKQARDRAKSMTNTTIRVRAPAAYAATDGDRSRLEAGGGDAESLIERAGALAEIGDMAGAIALLDAVLEKTPDDAVALKARGAAKHEARDYAGAAADYDRAVDLDPADAEASVGQGRAAMGEGRYPDAIVSFSVALRLDPEHVTGLSGRGSSYHQIGRWDRSLTDYRALKRGSPDSLTALLGELRALRHLERFDEARAIIDERLKEEPANLTALSALIGVTRDQGRPADALPALDAGVAAAPEALSALNWRGRVRAATGDETGARADFDLSRSLAGGDPSLLNNVCWNQAVVAFDLDRALTDCEAAVTGEANHLGSRALTLLQLGRFEEARTTYDQALAASPTQGSSLYGRGLARLALADAGGAEDISRARALDIEAAEDFEVFLSRHPELKP